MGGIVGRLFREFAVTLSVAILVSLIVSLTTTPMMCSQLLTGENPERRGRIYRASEHFFTWMLRTYERTLGWVLRHPAVTLAILLVTIGANIYLFVTVPKAFFPQHHNATFYGGIQVEQDISFQAMQTDTQRFVSTIKNDPAVANVMAFTGGSGATNGGFIYVGLKPLEERKVSAAQVIDRLRPKLMSLPSPSVFMQP